MAELIHALGIEWRILIAQAINFAILLFVLQRFVYRPVLRLLDERREGIKQTLEHEEKAASKLAAAETDREAILADARAVANRIIETARGDGEELKKKLLATAKDEISKMQAAADKKRKDEHTRLLSEVKSEIGTLIIETIERSLGDVLDARAQGRMVEQALAAIRETNGRTHKK